MNERIKQLRKERGVSQKEFAERLNVNQATVSCWEKGTRQPTRATLAIISQEFGVNVDWLMNGTGELKATPAPVAEDPLLEKALCLFRQLPPEAQRSFNRVFMRWAVEGKFGPIENITM